MSLFSASFRSGASHVVRIWPWLLTSVWLGACTESKPAPQAPIQPSRPGLHQLEINGHPLQVEIARTPEQHALGLMHRNFLPEDQGMLFIFDQPARRSFWMRHTRIPLTIAYLDASGRILELHDMQPFDETPISSRSDQVLYALEVNQGWFFSRKISPGDLVAPLPAPSPQ